VTIRRWDPLRDLLNLQERMNRLFEESVSRGRSDDDKPSPTWSPLADVYETAEGFVVQADLPGLTKADIEIRIEGNRLILKGERRLASSTRPDSFHRMERSHGPFERSFVFGEPVEPEKVTAVFQEGILRLVLPKARPRAVQKIRVERAP
jgi:HSP20 family protein